ncbi:MAG: magnesium/cobalt transporter CorA [Gammaproteobacteria bacterium]
MLGIYQSVDGAIRTADVDAVNDAIWIDVFAPDDDERKCIERVTGTTLPEVVSNGIEASARCFVDDHGLHLRSAFMTEHGGRHTLETVACLLQPERLVTVRPGRLRDFQLLRVRSRRGEVHSDTPLELLLDLLEQKIDQFATIIEEIHKRLEQVSQQVLEVGVHEIDDVIRELARAENSTGKVRLALTDTQLSAQFLERQYPDDESVTIVTKEIAQDVAALLSHSTFLFERVNFLMATAQGLISIEQNQIIKMFSIAAVVFLPPTLIASIYGMNFEIMPELEWGLGYLWAIGLMIASGVAPYWIFKHKGWL